VNDGRFSDKIIWLAGAFFGDGITPGWFRLE